MNIKYKTYTLEQEGANFNLYKEVDTKNQKTGLITKKDLNIGWGMKFSTCISRIITDMLADRNETVSLTYFIDEYRKLHSDITNSIGL